MESELCNSKKKYNMCNIPELSEWHLQKIYTYTYSVHIHIYVYYMYMFKFSRYDRYVAQTTPTPMKKKSEIRGGSVDAKRANTPI